MSHCLGFYRLNILKPKEPMVSQWGYRDTLRYWILAKKLNKDHPRYREIDIIKCATRHPGRVPLKIVLFNGALSLRKHVIKHMIKDAKNRIWQSVANINTHEVNNYKSKLNKIGCPWAIKRERYYGDNLPCGNGNICKVFDNCTEIISTLEQKYLSFAENKIMEAAQVPRYSCDESKTELIFSFLPNNIRVYAVAQKNSRDTILNLRTFYGDLSQRSWHEFLARQLERLERNSKGTLHLCSESEWLSSSSIGAKLNESTHEALKKLKNELPNTKLREEFKRRCEQKK